MADKNAMITNATLIKLFEEHLEEVGQGDEGNFKRRVIKTAIIQEGSAIYGITGPPNNFGSWLKRDPSFESRGIQLFPL